MNSNLSLQAVFDAAPVQADARRTGVTSSAPEQHGFRSHLESQLDQDRRSATQLAEKNASSATTGVEKKSVEPGDRAAESTGLEPLESGETLPLDEKVRNFLAALTPEEREGLLEEIEQWLASLSPEALQALQQQLTQDDVDWQAILPESLLQKLEALSVADDLEERMQALTQILAQWIHADADVGQLRHAQWSPSNGGELRLVTDSEASRATELRDGQLRSTAPQLADAQQRATGDATDQQQKDSGNSRQDRLAEMVARLSRADASAVSAPVSREGGDSLQQLLQAAGLGLQGVQSTFAGTAAGRLAGLAGAPVMQAAAQANAQALADRISLMQARGMQVAEMRLDPPHLGSVRVQIRMQGEQASVVFQAANAHARDLLEQSLPRLREMMAEEGLQLADAQVSEENFTEQREGEGGQAFWGGAGGNTGDDLPLPVTLLEQPLGLIDYYA